MSKSKKTSIKTEVDDLLEADDKNNVSQLKKDRVNVAKSIKSAPVSINYVLPYGYYFSSNYGIVRKTDDIEKDEYVISCPLLITGRWINRQLGTEIIQIHWLHDEDWKKVEVERGIICSAHHIVGLANYGFPVTSESARNVVSYLNQLEAINRKEIPVTEVTSQFGWNNETSCFLVGKDCIYPEPKDSIINNSVQNNNIVFSGKDLGEKQIAESFHSKGEFAEWVMEVNTLYDFPIVLFSVYTSLTAPLLEVLDIENFTFEISSPTSSGKTITLKIAASCWGNPRESSSGFFRTWKTTDTAIERTAQCLNGIPLILDDTKNAPRTEGKHKNSLPLVTSILYMITSGVGKARGTFKGMDTNVSFRTIMMSSGESPSIDMTNDRGTRARTISIWGRPFGANSAEMNKFVSNLEIKFKENYGHAGKIFAQFILDHKDDWAIWKKAYEEIKEKLVSRPGLNGPQMRVCRDIAVVATAIPLIHAAMPELRRDVNIQQIIENIVISCMGEIETPDNGSKALEVLKEYLIDNRNIIFTKEIAEKNVGINLKFKGIYSDYNGEKWTYIGFTRKLLLLILDNNDLNFKEVTRTLDLNGYLLKNSSSKGYQIQVQIINGDGNKLKENLYCITRKAFESSGEFIW